MHTTTDAINPPSWLSGASQDWFREMTDLYDFSDPAALRLLEAAGAQLDRLAVLRECLADTGPMVHDRFGQLRENPAASAERAASNTLRLLLREMDLSDGTDEAARLPRR